jgi:hypothetical protein
VHSPHAISSAVALVDVLLTIVVLAVAYTGVLVGAPQKMAVSGPAYTGVGVISPVPRYASTLCCRVLVPSEGLVAGQQSTINGSLVGCGLPRVCVERVLRMLRLWSRRVDSDERRLA